MNTGEVICQVIEALNEFDAPYMVVGSVATNFYCVPRATQDADIVVQSSISDCAFKLTARLNHLRFDRQLAFESVTATMKALLQSEKHNFQIELFELSKDAHDQERFNRRIRVDTLGTHAWIATIEDMIVTKLRWSGHLGREKDVSDVRNLIAVQSDTVDWPYVESWCDLHGTRKLLDRLRTEVQPSRELPSG